MATLKLSDDFYEPTCALVAVHCTMEAYRLVYLLNSRLGIKLRRIVGKKPDENNALSEYYEWENEMEDMVWSLIVNATKTVGSSGKSDLFSGVQTITSYLIPEMKKVDYFLKIDNAEGAYDLEKQIIQQINDIPRVAAAYEVDVNQLKSKHNLIF